MTEVSEQHTAQFNHKWEAVASAGKFGQFCRGELQNFANWLAEFGKIFRQKLQALLITNKADQSVYGAQESIIQKLLWHTRITTTGWFIKSGTYIMQWERFVNDWPRSLQ